MQIKGTAVKATVQFMKEQFPDRYKEWLDALPAASKQIMQNPIYATGWFSLMDSVIVPTEILGKMCFKNPEEGAWQVGAYSADYALKGIYKVFVRISSPSFMLSRASSIFASYYKPAVIHVTEKKTKRVVLRLEKFDTQERLIMHRIAGWLEKALEITKSSDIRVEVKHQLMDKAPVSHIIMEWG